MAEMTFEHKLLVTIGHTNMQKNVYWTRYAEWFGEVREHFLLKLLQMSGFSAQPDLRLDEVFEQVQIALETADFHIAYFRPAFFGDEVTLRINTSNIKEDSVELLGTFLSANNKKLAVCSQKIIFINPVQMKRISIPEFILTPGKKFEVEMDALSRRFLHADSTEV